MTVMPWGKHKGVRLVDLELRYLKWITKWLRAQPWAKAGLKQALWAEYGRRVVSWPDAAFQKVADHCPPELELLVNAEWDRRHDTPNLNREVLIHASE